MRLPLNEDSKQHRHRRRRADGLIFGTIGVKNANATGKKVDEDTAGHQGIAKMPDTGVRTFYNFMGADPEDHWAFGGRRFSPWRQGMDSFNPLVAGMMSKGGGLLPLIVLNFTARAATLR